MLPKNKFYVVLPLVFMAGFYKSGLFTNYTSSLKPALTFVAPEEASSPQYKGIKVKESQDMKFGYISESLYQNSTGSQESPSNMSGMNREANIPPFETHNRGGESAEKSVTKKILFYTKFFDEGWKTFLGNRTNLTLQGCPETRCVFTFDPADDDPSDADALIFHANDFDVEAIPRTRRPHQRYVWLNLEAPAPQNRLQNRRHWVPNFFNWTLTYNRDSHLFMPYGVLTPLRAEEQDISGRPSLLNRSSKTFLKYMQDLSNNVTLEDDLQHDWSSFLRRPKVVAWMVSNCHTWSDREKYARELQKHIHIDVYGKCGSLVCGRNHRDTYCYTDVLSTGYLFYLAFENNLCRDYVTEKVFFAMLHGLVPIVYGGASYEDYLPPHSYIDARTLAPKDLAKLLVSAAESPEEYARYHLWRRYWRVTPFPPFCELCFKLHWDNSTTTVPDMASWWRSANNCTYLRTAMGGSSSFGGFSFSESLSEAAGLLRYLAKTALQVV